MRWYLYITEAYLPIYLSHLYFTYNTQYNVNNCYTIVYGENDKTKSLYMLRLYTAIIDLIIELHISNKVTFFRVFLICGCLDPTDMEG